MRLLVTGASGFIGTHLVMELENNLHSVVELDMQDGNLLDPHSINHWLDLTHPDVVVHLAAKVGRLFGEDDLTATILDNAAMTAIVAQACGSRGIQMVYASTSEVYGDMGEKIAYEGGICQLPHNLYGLSKRWGEEVARLYAPNGLVCLRLSMPYGPGLPAGRGRAAMINFLYNATLRETITVHRGSERSWCWVGDTVAGIAAVIEQENALHLAGRPLFGGPQGAGIWNIGRDDIAVSMRTVAEMACALTGASMDIIEEVDPPEMQTVVKRLSTSKLRKIGWTPKVELGEGMERTLAWIKAGFPPLRAKED